MHERSLVSVKVEPLSTSRFEAQHFLSCFYFIYVKKIYVRQRAWLCVAKNASVKISLNRAMLGRAYL